MNTVIYESPLFSRIDLILARLSVLRPLVFSHVTAGKTKFPPTVRDSSPLQMGYEFVAIREPRIGRKMKTNERRTTRDLIAATEKPLPDFIHAR